MAIGVTRKAGASGRASKTRHLLLSHPAHAQQHTCNVCVIEGAQGRLRKANSLCRADPILNTKRLIAGPARIAAMRPTKVQIDHPVLLKMRLLEMAMVLASAWAWAGATCIMSALQRR